MNKKLANVFFGGAAMVLSVATGAGCAHETTPAPAIPKVDYRVGIDDLVDVAVWKDPALSATVPVRPDGKITLPMIGDLVAVGKTTHELEAIVKDRLKGFVSEPTVSVMVKEIRSGKFFVLGEVTHPGAYPITSNISVLQALAVAGGPTEFARRGKIVVIRASDGKEQRYHVDYDDVVSGEKAAIQLVAGDTLFVP